MDEVLIRAMIATVAATKIAAEQVVSTDMLTSVERLGMLIATQAAAARANLERATRPLSS